MDKTVQTQNKKLNLEKASNWLAATVAEVILATFAAYGVYRLVAMDRNMGVLMGITLVGALLIVKVKCSSKTTA